MELDKIRTGVPFPNGDDSPQYLMDAPLLLAELERHRAMAAGLQELVSNGIDSDSFDDLCALLERHGYALTFPRPVRSIAALRVSESMKQTNPGDTVSAIKDQLDRSV